MKGIKEESEGDKVDQIERFICERENLVFDSLIYFEPVERFKNRSNVIIVNFRMNERSSNGAGSSLINSITNTS